MHYDATAIKAELEIVDRLIAEKCLQPMRLERAAKLAEHGLTGFACADGLYNRATADCCEQIHFVQHLLKLNGTGFLLGMDPNHYAGRQRRYLESAQFALMYDLDVAFHKLKKGSSVLMLSHSPNCGQRLHFNMDVRNMLLATHRAHDRVANELAVNHDIVLPMVMVDRTYGELHPAKKKIELYVVKHELMRRYDQ